MLHNNGPSKNLGSLPIIDLKRPFQVGIRISLEKLRITGSVWFNDVKMALQALIKTDKHRMKVRTPQNTLFR